MKKILYFLPVTVFILTSHAKAQNNNTSCQSLTSNVIRVSGQVLTKAGEILEMAGRKLGPYIVTAATGNPVFSSSAEARNAISDFAGDAIAKQMEIFAAIGQLDGNGGGTIGARNVYVPTKRVTGELWTERTFVAAPSSYHKVTVKIKKLDGKAGARIAVCGKYADGTEYNTLNQNEFADGDNNIGTEKTWVLNNMQDKYVTIHLVHTGIVTNKFEYELSITGEHDPSRLPRSNNNNNNTGKKGKNSQPVLVQSNPAVASQRQVMVANEQPAVITQPAATKGGGKNKGNKQSGNPAAAQQQVIATNPQPVAVTQPAANNGTGKNKGNKQKGNKQENATEEKAGNKNKNKNKNSSSVQ